jgi:hyperosmotically inducible periplasmic protein
MKKRVFLSMMVSIVLIACERQDQQGSPSSTDQEETGSASNTTGQPESDSDRAVTQKIRKMLMSDDSLSTNGKNVKVTTAEGVVTLSGPVDSAKEKEDIARKINNIQGVRKVDNQLQVTGSNS